MANKEIICPYFFRRIIISSEALLIREASCMTFSRFAFSIKKEIETGDIKIPYMFHQKMNLLLLVNE
jgi:hypothetical protein